MWYLLKIKLILYMCTCIKYLSLLIMTPVMPFNNVNNIALGHNVIPSLFSSFSGSPLLFE